MLKKRRVIPHYTKDPEIECIDAIHAALGDEGFVAYCRGCILKYTWRYEHKGQRQEDAAKIQDYAFFAEQVTAPRALMLARHCKEGRHDACHHGPCDCECHSSDSRKSAELPKR